MRRSDLRRALVAATTELAGVAVDLDPLLDALDAGVGGLTARRYDGPGGLRPMSSPTENLALAPDAARAARAEVDRLVQDVFVAAGRLGSLRRGWLTKLGSDAVIADENGRPAGCRVMTDLVGAWERVERVSDLGGLLDTAQPVCRWVATFARRHGRLPTAAEARVRASGHKVRVAAA